eukprot:scaffold40425_cov150-Skeletonema_dohrnii-CCMP3373.AAC.1
MPSDRPVDKEFDVMEHQQEQEPDFFSLFGLPTYEDGVNFGSSITSSIRRPMSAILAVVDNALAVLNEEFDSSEDSLMSSSSNDTDAHQQANTSNRSGHTSNSKVSGCRRRTRRTKTSKMGTIDSSDSSSTSNGDKQNIVDSLSESNSDGDDVLMKSSVIGSISKLVLHDEFHAKEQKKDGINANMADNLRDCLASDLEKK